MMDWNACSLQAADFQAVTIIPGRHFVLSFQGSSANSGGGVVIVSVSTSRPDRKSAMALPTLGSLRNRSWPAFSMTSCWPFSSASRIRSEEHTSELQSLMRISYAVFCLKKTKNHKYKTQVT